MSYAGIFTDKNNTDHPVTSTLYGTCDTAAATAAKVVTCADVDALTSGMTIRVKFTNANTAESPTINVNSTGAKTVYRFGTTAPVDGDSWKAGEVVELLYDGTYFYMVSADDIGSKQDTLTFDSAPTSASTNPVTSGGVYAALADKADNDIIAAEFDSTANYVVGNYCIYQGGLYKFKANHTGAWAAADVDAITIAGELTAKQPKTDNNLTTTSKDTTGAINELKSGLNDQTTPQLVTTVTLASGLSGKVTCVKIGQMVLVSGYCTGTMAQNDEIVQNLPAYRGGFNIQECRYPAILDGNIVSPVMFTASTAISVVAACSSVNFFLAYVTN